MDVQCPGEGAQQQQALVVNIVPAEVLRFEMVCRVCGNEDESNIQIFGADGQSYELALKMNTYLPVKVADGDGLPSNCCWNCASLILSWHELVVASAENDRKLKELQVVIAKPFVVPAAHPEVEPEAVLPDMRDEEVTSVSLSAFYDPNVPGASDALSHPTDKDELKLPEYPQQGAFSPPEAAGKKLASKPNILKTSKADNVYAKRNPTEETLKYDFACEYCGAMFVRDEEILRHVRERHPNEIDLSDAPQGPEKREKRKHTKIDQEAVSAAKVTIDGRVYYNCKACGKSLYSPYTYLWHVRIHTGERPYVCDLCGKQFRVSQGLARHLRETHQGIKKFGCDLCGRMFSTRRNVDEHRRIHTNERPYVCDLCGKAFKQKASLFVHNRSHTDHFPYGCAYCELRFRTRPPLLVHMSRHTGERPYPCDECGRCFRVKYELKRHMLVHSDEKPFVCGECGLSFRQKRYLRNHAKTNHGRLNAADTAIVKKEDEGSAGFKDTVVIKKEDEGSVDSSTTSSLDRKVEAWKSDETTHLTSWQTSQKPTCDVCGKLFSSNSTLFRHRRTVHKGIASPPTPHVTCNTCNKSFTGNRSLTQHKRDSPENATDRTYTCKRCREESKVPKRIRRGPDENSTRFSCKICDGKYFRKSDLIRHIRTKHPQCDDDLPPKRASLAKYKLTVDGKALYECDVCQKRYSKPFSFSVHRRMHATGARSHPCAVCGRRYSTKSSLQRHCTESHIGGPLACRVCGAQFRAKVLLAQHLNIHSDRRPYACGVCGKAFRQSSTLSVHKLSHGADFRFRCDACGKGFRRGNDLKVHAARHRQHAGGHDPLATDPCDVKPAGVFERSREES